MTVSRAVIDSSDRMRAASSIVRAENSAIVRPATRTASAGARSRAPAQAGHGDWLR
jgi:hypothetical protein